MELGIYKHIPPPIVPYGRQDDPKYRRTIGFRALLTHATLFLVRLDWLIRLITCPSFD
jgi:hypothetical protein